MFGIKKPVYIVTFTRAELQLITADATATLLSLFIVEHDMKKQGELARGHYIITSHLHSVLDADAESFGVRFMRDGGMRLQDITGFLLRNSGEPLKSGLKMLCTWGAPEEFLGQFPEEELRKSIRAKLLRLSACLDSKARATFVLYPIVDGPDGREYGHLRVLEGGKAGAFPRAEWGGDGAPPPPSAVASSGLWGGVAGRGRALDAAALRQHNAEARR